MQVQGALLSVDHGLIGLLELQSSPVEAFGMCPDCPTRQKQAWLSPC